MMPCVGGWFTLPRAMHAGIVDDIEGVADIYDIHDVAADVPKTWSVTQHRGMKECALFSLHVCAELFGKIRKNEGELNGLLMECRVQRGVFSGVLFAHAGQTGGRPVIPAREDRLE